MKFLSIGLLSLIGFIKMASSTNSSTLSPSTDSPTLSPSTDSPTLSLSTDSPTLSPLVDWNVKQCSYSNGKPYKQCNDLLGCQCSHNETVNNGICIQCIDGCTLIRTKIECNANMHCEFNFQCERIDLFSQTTVRFYHIEVQKEDWDSINSREQWEDEPYVPCIFTMNYQQKNEKSFEYAKVKVKGSVGAKSTCDISGTNTSLCRSLSYQINIDKNLPDDFVGEEPKIGGKDKIQFHAMNNDHSLMIERLSYSIMHHYLNITTARAVHCVLFVNDEKLGIYLNVEEIDEKSIGPILFGEKGTMYKDGWPRDEGFLDISGNIIKEEGMNLMEKLIDESLQCVSKDRLTMSCSPERGKTMLKKYIDTDSFTKAMIVNHLLNNFDGTPKSTHNHYWFRNKNEGPYIFVPWDYNNLIMNRFCKVNKDTGIIEGFGDIMSSVGPFVENLNGVCAAPPFQYLPSTPEERELVCVCVPSFSPVWGLFNVPMACYSAFGLVASQSLADDYFKIRDNIFKENEIKVKNEVKSMVEYWSNQIRTHVDTSSIIYPTKNIWEEMIGEILLYFDYGLDQLMNRKKELKREDIDAHFEWIKNRSKELTKCGNERYYCQSDSDCEYGGCEMEEMTYRACSSDSKCYVGNENAEECAGIMDFKSLEGGYFCLDATKYKMCPPEEVIRCQSNSDCEHEGCEMENMSFRMCNPDDMKCLIGIAKAPDCEGMELQILKDGSTCYEGTKFVTCPPKISQVGGGGKVNRCELDSDCEYEGCEMEEVTPRCRTDDSKCYAVWNAKVEECEGIMDGTPLENEYFCFNATKLKLCPEKKQKDIDYTEAPISSSDVEKKSSETSTAESKNGLFGIAAILILLSFIL